MTSLDPLHEAVHRTANRMLNDPVYDTLGTWGNLSDLESRLYWLLYDLGYSNEKSQRARIHPLAYRYFREYGEEYVLMLEAAQRLTQ